MRKAFLIAVPALFLIAATVAWALSRGAPDFSDLRRSVQVRIRLADGTPSTRRVGPQTPDWVPLPQISTQLIFALIASEDTSFFSHKGIDIHEIKEAIKKDLKEKRFARGASTLTQQLIKNVYLTHEKTLTRKIREIFWATQLEKELTKQEIITFYANLVEWGPGIYGIREAAQHYFAIPPSQLTAKQSAFLALLLPSPRKYHQYYEDKALSEWAQRRIDRILRVMQRMNFINEPTYTAALEEPLWPPPLPLPTLTPTENEETETSAIAENPESTAEPTPAPIEDTPPPTPTINPHNSTDPGDRAF